MAFYDEDITQLTDYSDFKNFLLTMMGEGLVSVEIEDEHVKAAFQRATDIYKRQGNNNLKHRFVALDVEKDKTEYDLPEPTIETIVNVVQTRGGFATEDPFEVSAINNLFNFYNSYGTSDLITYDLTMQQIELLRKYSAHEQQFIHDRLNNTIRFLRQPRHNSRWFLEAYLNLSTIEYMKLPWIQSYTVAELKGILGRAYRKFSSLPTPSGEVSLDGDQLIQESQQEKEDLMQQILNYVDSGVPIGGAIIMG